MVFFKSVRKLMGWCPQETDFPTVKGVFNTDYAHSDKRQSKYYPVENMDVPIQMFDRRIFSIVLTLGISGFISIFFDLFNGFPGYVLVYIIFILLFISIDRIKISIDNEKIQISTPLLKPVNIPKQNINCIKIIDNSIYKHRWINIFLIIFIMLFIFLQVLTLYRKIIRSTPLEEMVFSFVMPIFLIFLLISPLQRNIRRSHYPKAIKIETTNSITLYPRNESEFNILKGELEK
ncbi:MAG: hypothetical protein MPEBLZ_02944 [Candidatus Methanoperedens nitroreducens]|uniref:DUF1673 family protein n=1 Tax=Candidatus Methanoperedens nitratireducens TaxID=1392998 RepID=A0A0P8DXQ0_9EURY|nr:DUF1673 family protein [Candidatus Methanoperedens sp. BLZ2]KAB2944902.1 MAG: DUF1673 family protein [Candidatus Methanoperedens sp.]KPQ42486.1 MAG: hypothetical protein MPEBLZ_02944 [Candidatus Methanoperedens sp. BLZ1]MBZ0173778.1 DUF1673 family protein [Candidatus Methanoperedens nitroreducens]MCX9078279.1 DUF1673 family protein [Candidatus Methanoperedens sp.]MCX9089566.1 DUF1673 family protein [Candidatus Methanoperedens sp.]